jgi:hypothetical protein
MVMKNQSGQKAWPLMSHAGRHGPKHASRTRRRQATRSTAPVTPTAPAAHTDRATTAPRNRTRHRPGRGTLRPTTPRRLRRSRCTTLLLRYTAPQHQLRTVPRHPLRTALPPSSPMARRATRWGRGRGWLSAPRGACSGAWRLPAGRACWRTSWRSASRSGWGEAGEGGPVRRRLRLRHRRAPRAEPRCTLRGCGLAARAMRARGTG